MRVTRRRVLLSLLVVITAGMTVLALTDRKAAYSILYVVGAILLLLGSAAGLGGGVRGPIRGSSTDAVDVHRSDMQQRLGGLSQNLVLLLVGAVLIGIAVLLNLV